MKWPWFKNKQTQQEIENAAQAKPVDRKLECPYCGHRFEANEFVFAMRHNEAHIDEKRLEFYQNHYLTQALPKYQRLFCTDWTMENAELTEDIRIGSEVIKVPLMIRATFKPAQYGDSDDQQDEAGDALCETGLSSHRLCPHCHGILDKGCCTHKKIIIGLYGGKRSGKTTFMTMVTYYMNNKFDALGLGKIRIAEESRPEANTLLEDALDESGLDPTAVVIRRTCFPIVAIVEPHKGYEPFILVFQDIPGEFAHEGAADQLLQREEFLRINSFLGIADINMFTMNTPERKNMQQLRTNIKRLERSIDRASETDADEQQLAAWEASLEEANSNLAMLENRICTMKYRDVFGDLPFAPVLREVDSVQIVMTKIDEMLKDEEGKKLLGPLNEINRDHSGKHENGIHQQHLQFAHAHAQMLLSDECKNSQGTMLDWIANEFSSNKLLRKAYCAIASREDVDAGFGGRDDIAWTGCMNILDPILNICMWKKLLPVKSANPDESPETRQRKK